MRFAVRCWEFCTINLSSPATITLVAIDKFARLRKFSITVGSPSKMKEQWFVSSKYTSTTPVVHGSDEPILDILSDRLPPKHLQTPANLQV